MGKRIDLTGQVFGKLTVISFHGKDKFNGAIWLCKCECGNEIVVTRQCLRVGDTTSCGCAHTKPPGEHAWNLKYTAYRHSALKRNIIFILNKEQFIKLCSDNCFYCGAEPTQINPTRSVGYGQTAENYARQWIAFNGIDRVDSSKGYTIENVVTCCSNCNYAKMDFTQDEFLLTIKKQYDHLSSKGLI